MIVSGHRSVEEKKILFWRARAVQYTGIKGLDQRLTNDPLVSVNDTSFFVEMREQSEQQSVNNVFIVAWQTEAITY